MISQRRKRLKSSGATKHSGEPKTGLQRKPQAKLKAKGCLVDGKRPAAKYRRDKQKKQEVKKKNRKSSASKKVSPNLRNRHFHREELIRVQGQGQAKAKQ